MIDQQAFDEFLFDRLRERAPLVALIEDGPDDYGPGVYPETIPDDVPLRAIVYDFLPDLDTNPQGKQRQMSGGVALVHCLAEGTAYPWDVAAEIDLALDGASAVIGGHRIACERISGFRLKADRGSAPFRFAGGRYRLTSSHPLT